ncbi:hypothetical protein Agub_g2095 [Astrephomene gubernaculifera]|uniref:SET domain-containing protein n=1 Tax=Astrephomene gubernaculifera TaxID=47775 RepID=A0AAD3DJ80_9CHLO|nr:hypothetical protein Agub_g2095 [Astrephomene gubernaculifera]
MAKTSMQKKDVVGDGKHSSAASTDFRSPVGCTGITRGEQEFLAWCKEERVRFPSSHLAALANTGRALVASRAIKMGEVVVEVPDDAVLMADNCSIRDVLDEEGLCKPADDEILEVQGLVIAVMYEKWRGEQSRWAPYLALLPDDMTHMPLYWKRREFLELRGTAAYDKMMGRLQHPADAPTQVPLLWSEVVAPFIAEHPELELPGGQQGYELYRWATCAVASYSFILGDDKYQAMVPVWDLLNHITGAVNVRLHHCARRHVLQMLATRDIRAGEELVNNYGELSNAELLRGYGFVERSNRNNHVQVPLALLMRVVRQELQQEQAAAGAGEAAGPGPGSAASATAPAAEVRRAVAARLRLGRRLGLLPLHDVFKVYAGRPAPAALTALLHLLLAGEEQAEEVRRAARRAAGAAHSGKQRRGGKVDKQAKAAAAIAAVAAALKQEDSSAGGGVSGSAAAVARLQRVYERVVSYMLGRYGNSLEEDERLMGLYDSLPPRQRAALLARKPEKEALVWLREEIKRKGGLQRSLALGGAEAARAVGKSVAGAGGNAAGKAAVGSEDVGGEGRGKKAAGRKASDDAKGGVKPQEAQFSFGFSL